MIIRSASWKASQAEKKRQARRALCQERGYNIGTHLKENAERNRGRASPKIKEYYKKRVHKYEEFLIEERKMPKGYKIGEGHPAPILQELKAFFCWLIESTKGKISLDRRPTMNTVLVRAQGFIPGFFLETGNKIPQEVKDLYHWIEYELVERHVLSTITKPKYNFKLSNYERAIITLWASNDFFFIYKRRRDQFHFLTLLSLCTGARVSSLAPALENQRGRGLCYKEKPCILPILEIVYDNTQKHIQLVLFRADDAPWSDGGLINILSRITETPIIQYK
ncbi:hypothetical protein BO70DRAFT_286929 [Aspergillus heteromorphus CBS 117.55]|uniref:Uncharacterized protein n=1 Tax=Aspergillus heteromorphus CBS 117.55 TaxID=1448321 RepID=A0A317WPK8_9EURO|nr:uncharacterized protein BO70DRAFT_286929 [Aspergillus heteromorphus CBS 117.55]PWY88353.1 hypothetical protein BO70DRAFT_286929 [Aspergillus heteromorphus CBS 117.55]